MHPVGAPDETPSIHAAAGRLIIRTADGVVAYGDEPRAGGGRRAMTAIMMWPSGRARMGEAGEGTVTESFPLGGWPGALQPSRPPRVGLRVAGGVAASIALVAAGVAGAVVLPGDEPPHPDRWDPRLVELVDFVEAERGLSFEHPIYVDFLTPEEYTARTTVDADELTEEERSSLDESLALLRALGLASGEVDLFDSMNELSDSGTLAFYDTAFESASVRGTELDVATRVSVVHELTHALQDQHFDLDAMADEAGEADGTSYDAYLGLIEGDATRIEDAYVDTLSDAELDDYLRQYGDVADASDNELAGVPAVLQAFQATPYALGPALLALLAEDGGNRAVDEAFRDPPTTGEHLLEPLSYLDRDQPADVDPPSLPDDVDEPTDEGDMSAVDLYLILGARIDPFEALTAADGWGGSPFVAYEDSGDGRDGPDGRTCVRIRAVGDTAEDSAQLYDAFERWVAAAPDEAGATLSGDRAGPAVLQSCDPGAAAAAPGEDRAFDLLTVPSVRSILMLNEMQAGAEPADAWEAGDCIVRRFTLDEIVAANGPDPIPGFEEQLLDARAACLAGP